MLGWLAAAALAIDVAPPRADGPVLAVGPSTVVAHIDQDTPFSRDAADWTLSCGATALTAASLAVRTVPVALLPTGWPYTAVVAHDVVLRFESKLPPGDCLLGDGSVSLAYTHDPETGRTPSLHLNQVGALPGAAHAAMSYWIPGDPLVPGDGDRAFHVVDGDSGATVLTGEMALRTVVADDAYGNDYTEAQVWDLDLASLGDGWYYVVWDGVGRSWSFRVGADAWDEPFEVAFRGLLHQRCGIALDPSLTPWSHGACHTAPVEQTSADYQVVGEDAFTALPAADLGTSIDAHGGWHDAADYDRNWGHLKILDDLVDLFELDTVLHAGDALGLPESGNGVPDLLDEAAWGISTWSRLQTADGGVPGCVGTTAYPDFDEMPDDDDGAWYACAPDPVASYRYAGAAAKLSRAIAPFDAATSADLLDRANRAWAWAEANPRSYDTTYNAVYAAAELLRTTGDASWDAVFRERGPLVDPAFALADWDGDDWDEALYAYASADSADAATRDHAVAVLDGRAASWMSWAQGSSWRIAKHPYAPITNGTATTPAGAGILIRAWKLTGNADYLAWAGYACDVTLGANPSGWSWTTGLGDHPVAQPLQTPSLADGIEAPVPGITVYGPSYLTSGSDNVAVTLAAFEPPIDQWPLLERYADVAYVPNMNEFTVTENIGPTLFAFGALASWTSPADDGPGPTSDPASPADAGSSGGGPEDGGCGCDSSASAGWTWLLALSVASGRRRRRVSSSR